MLLVVFGSRWRHFDIDFVFFVFLSDFLRNGFPNSLIVRSGFSILCSQRKCFELYVRTCPALFFTSSNRFLLRLTLTSWN